MQTQQPRVDHGFRVDGAAVCFDCTDGPDEALEEIETGTTFTCTRCRGVYVAE